MSDLEDIYYDEPFEEFPSQGSQLPNFTVHDRKDIPNNMKSDVNEISSTLSINFNFALTILRKFHWSSDLLYNEWFGDNSVYQNMYTKFTAAVPVKKSYTCGICYDDFSPNKTYVSNCGHCYCHECFTKFLESTVLNKGIESLYSHCPECDLLITDKVFFKFLKPKSQPYKIYENHIINAYIDLSRDRIWCISQSCPNYISSKDSSKKIVICGCGAEICFTCREQPHAPATCDMVREWNKKSTDDGLNTEWLVTHTKQCPKCHQNIEKNEGCMHMTCRYPSCRHEFCWLCLGDWTTHGSATGGYYKCNIFDETAKSSDYQEKEAKKQKVMEQNKRYQFYYERVIIQRKAEELIHQKLATVNKEIKFLSETCTILLQDLEFMRDAQQRLLVNHRTLTWSYVYAFFEFDNQKNTQSKPLFEHQQALLETNTNLLNDIFEKRLPIINEFPIDLKKFNDYRIELLNLLYNSKHLSDFIRTMNSNY